MKLILIESPFISYYEKKGNHRKPNLPTDKVYKVGVDASTSAFGFSIVSEDNSIGMMAICMRGSEQSGKQLRAEAINYMHQCLFDLEHYRTITYERTPENFEKDTHAVKVMKQTERAVKEYFDKAIDKKYKDYVFPIFPNSWKAPYVDQDIENNKGKVDKLENAKSILSNTPHPFDTEEVISFLSGIAGHDFDCVESLGINYYGSDIIVFDYDMKIRTFRDFEKTKSRHLFYVKVDKSEYLKVIENFQVAIKYQGKVFYENPTKTITQNMHAIVSENDFNTLIFLGDENNTNVLPFIINEPFHKDEALIMIDFPPTAVSEKMTKMISTKMQREVKYITI